MASAGRSSRLVSDKIISLISAGKSCNLLWAAILPMAEGTGDEASQQNVGGVGGIGDGVEGNA